MSQSQKFKIQMSEAYNHEVREVDARPIVIKGFEDWKFFIHKDFEDDTKYVVSESLTGASIGKAFDETATYLIATSNLNSVGKQGFDKMVTDIIKKTMRVCNATQ